jgi:hypothetical protein
MRFFGRSQRADRAPVVCTYLPTPGKEATGSALVHRVYLAIVGHGRTPKVSGVTSAPEACPAATRRAFSRPHPRVGDYCPHCFQPDRMCPSRMLSSTVRDIRCKPAAYVYTKKLHIEKQIGERSDLRGAPK